MLLLSGSNVDLFSFVQVFGHFAMFAERFEASQKKYKEERAKADKEKKKRKDDKKKEKKRKDETTAPIAAAAGSGKGASKANNPFGAKDTPNTNSANQAQKPKDASERVANPFDKKPAREEKKANPFAKSNGAADPEATVVKKANPFAKAGAAGPGPIDGPNENNETNQSRRKSKEVHCVTITASDCDQNSRHTTT